MSTFLHLTRRQIPSVLQVCAGPAHLQAQSLLNSSVQDRNQRSCSAAAVSVSTCCLHHHTTSHYITLHHITSHYITLHHTAGKNITDQHQNTTYADLAGGHQQDQHMLCFGAGLCWFWSVQVLICAGFDLCRFWSVLVLVCAGFDLCWFSRTSCSTNGLHVNTNLCSVLILCSWLQSHVSFHPTELLDDAPVSCLWFLRSKQRNSVSVMFTWYEYKTFCPE